MNKWNKAKSNIFMDLIFIVIFMSLLVVTIVNVFDSYEGELTLKNSLVGLVFLGLVVLLAIAIIIFVTVVSKERTSQVKEDDFLPFEEDDFNFINERHIEEVDYKIISGIEYVERGVNYIQQEASMVEFHEDEYVEIDENEDIKEISKAQGDEKSRFYMLSQIDAYYRDVYKKPKYNNEITLEKICENFRNFSARYLKLYYDIEDIRRFIGGLAVTRLIILQGMSGTGKTSLAYAFGEYLSNKTVVVPIQPMWKERTDLVGYYNEFTKKFNETTLLYKMYEANYNDEVYITVLDEMNIARIEYYFAEFLSLLELPNPEGRNLDVVSDKWENDPILLKEGKLRLPINMWFVGTANNDDSTFAISDKVYDRAMVLNLDKRAKPFEAPRVEKMKISSSYLQKLYKEAQEEYEISERNLRRIRKLDEFMISHFHLTFGNRIMKQINQYVPVIVSCGGTELEAIDDILSRKVFRKLESKNPVYVRQQVETVCAYLDELFGQDKMPLCKEAIRLIEQNV